MQFTCGRCGYEVETRHLLKKHLNRRTVCPATNNDIPIATLKAQLDESDKVRPYNCKHCNKGFTEPNNMYRHQKRCSKAPQKETSTSSTSDEISQLRNEIEKMKTELSRLKNERNATHTTNHIVNNNTTNIHQNIIVLNNFGHETYDHIGHDFLDCCIRNDVSGMNSLIEKIHFSDEVPANNNVRLKSSKRKLVEVAHSQNWIVKDANDAMETMIRKGNRLLLQFFNEMNENEEGNEVDDEHNEDSVEAQIRNRIYDTLMELSDKNSKKYHALTRRIFAMLYDHRG
jgi:uncharacterized protein (DUF342 family)